MQLNATARAVLSFLAAISLLPASARAVDVAVNCPSESLQDAINGLDYAGPHSVTFSGVCSGPIAIIDRVRITLDGQGSGQIQNTTNASNVDTAALRVAGSSGIILSGFSVNSTVGAGLVVTRASEVRAAQITASNNHAQGIVVNVNSVLTIDTSTTTGNAAAGIRVDTAVLNINGGFNSTGNQGNGLTGATARINVTGLEATLAAPAAPNSFSNNQGGGLGCSDSCRVNISGPNSFNGNGGSGVFVFHGSTVNMFGATVTGNGDSGFVAGETSHAETGSDVISGNGGSTGAAGFVLYDHGEGYIDGDVQITGNLGGGMDVTAGSLLSSTGNNTVANNTGTGVAIDHDSIAHYFAPDTLSGNTGSSLSCDTTSLVCGNVGNPTNVSCARIDRGGGPTRPRPLRPQTNR